MEPATPQQLEALRVHVMSIGRPLSEAPEWFLKRDLQGKLEALRQLSGVMTSITDSKLF